jgi:hypothetical protein
LLLPSTSEKRHCALVLASQYGHAEIVSLLLDAGKDPNRYNPIGIHAHSTPLHQAVAGGHDLVVRRRVGTEGAECGDTGFDRIFKQRGDAFATCAQRLQFARESAGAGEVLGVIQVLVLAHQRFSVCSARGRVGQHVNDRGVRAWYSRRVH